MKQPFINDPQLDIHSDQFRWSKYQLVLLRHIICDIQWDSSDFQVALYLLYRASAENQIPGIPVVNERQVQVSNIRTWRLLHSMIHKLHPELRAPFFAYCCKIFAVKNTYQDYCQSIGATPNPINPLPKFNMPSGIPVQMNHVLDFLAKVACFKFSWASEAYYYAVDYACHQLSLPDSTSPHAFPHSFWRTILDDSTASMVDGEPFESLMRGLEGKESPFFTGKWVPVPLHLCVSDLLFDDAYSAIANNPIPVPSTSTSH